MRFYQDWRFWSFVIASVSLFCTVGLGCLLRHVYVKIRFNDLKHLNLNFKEFKKESKDNTKKLFGRFDTLSQQISNLNGVCSERDTRLKNLENKIK